MVIDNQQGAVNIFKDVLENDNLVDWKWNPEKSSMASHDTAPQDFVMTPKEFTRFTIGLAQAVNVNENAGAAYVNFVNTKLPLILAANQKYTFSSDIINSWVTFMINNKYNFHHFHQVIFNQFFN